MQQLRKQLTGRERREIVCVKYIHQGWLRAAQTSVSLDVEARPGVLPAACHHPACSHASRDASAAANIQAEDGFSGRVAWQGGKGRVGVEEEKPVMFLNGSAEAGLRFPPRAQTYLGRALIGAQPRTHRGKEPPLPGALGPSWDCRLHSSSALERHGYSLPPG